MSTWAKVTALDVPTVRGPLRHVRVRFRHDAKDPEADIAKALSTVMGKGQVYHYAGVRRAVRWRKNRWDVMATTRKQRGSLRASELKASQLRELVAALQTVEGARAVQARGRRRIHP